MEPPRTASLQADAWDRQARQNKTIGWILAVAGTLALVVGYEQDRMTMMLVAIWVHICGEATLVWAFGLERSSRLLRLLSLREPNAIRT